MGVYLNSKKPHTIYKNIAQSTYFVDKTALLKELIPLVETEGTVIPQINTGMGKDNRYICITRPRRFGKTVMASMAASFFGKGRSSKEVFDKLDVSSAEGYERHLNKHNVIYIPFNESPKDCKNYQQYINRIQKRLTADLKKSFLIQQYVTEPKVPT